MARKAKTKKTEEVATSKETATTKTVETSKVEKTETKNADEISKTIVQKVVEVIKKLIELFMKCTDWKMKVFISIVVAILVCVGFMFGVYGNEIITAIGNWIGGLF